MAIITDTVLLDSTGQDIVGKLDAIKDALTPAPIVYNNAGAHNSIFRGKYLGNAVSADQWTAIDGGTFEDMYVGDYWTIGGVNWRIAGFDLYLHNGDTELATHHVVMVPDTCLYTAKMNNSDITTGGYAGSVMHSTNLASAKTTINGAFNGHVLTVRLLITNSVSGAQANNWAWTDETVFLMNEVEVFGCHAWGDLGHSGYNTGNGCKQYPLFSLAPEFMVADYSGARQWWWLRDVVSASTFARCDSYGTATYASASYAGGVRPAFLIS